MLGLNPWRLSRDRFCFLWLEAVNLDFNTFAEGKGSIKGAILKRAYLLKVGINERGQAYVTGKWDRYWKEGQDPLKDLLSFISDSYLVSYRGYSYVFRLLEENLLRNNIDTFNKDYILDVEDIFGWVENKEYVDEVLGEIEKIYDAFCEVEEKVDRIKDWFEEYMWPLLKNGI